MPIILIFFFIFPPHQALSSPPPKDNFIISFPLHLTPPKNSPKHPLSIQDTITTSLARARFFSQTKPSSSSPFTSAPVSGRALQMQFSIGTPPVSAHGVFDTGSVFTWIQCSPCTACVKQSHPIFNSTASSSFRKLPCGDPKCQTGPNTRCGKTTRGERDLCFYESTYMDGSYSKGIVSTETVTFEGDGGRKTTVEGVVFGCGTENEMERYSGIVGLGRGEASILTQLNVKHFSYYVSARGDDVHGMVHLGPGASLTDLGMTTPILQGDRHDLYYLNLTGISVDGSDLDIPKGIFDITIDEARNYAGFVIDSGTTYTMLRSEAFDALKSAVMEAMYEDTPETADNFELCYRDVSGAPEVVLQFSGLDYVLCDANLWVRHWKGFKCLGFLRLKESHGKLNILGFHQQRNVQVGYDLEKGLLSLVYPGACPNDDLV